MHARHLEHAESRRACGFGLKLVPLDRQCNGRAGARARRVGADGRGFHVVAQIIDEDLANAFRLRHRGEKTLRLLTHHFVDERAREFLHCGPGGAGFDRHDDVQTLAARQLRECVQSEALESLLDGQACARDLAPRHVRSGIEIEHDDVGLIEMPGARAPDMQLEHADLYQREQRLPRRRSRRTDPRPP